MGGSREEYISLRTDEGDENEATIPMYRTNSRTRMTRFLCAIIVVQSIGLLFFAFRVFQVQSPSCVPVFKSHSLLYSPAEDHLEYQVKVFPNVMDITPYRGVSDDVDKAWKDLYKGTFMRLPRDEAAKLPNRTWPIADEPGYYIAQFDVFHQLHCLNYLRQSLDREHYLKTHDAEGLADHHLRHCVDSIRESLMCSSDIASIVWQWDEEVHGVRGRTAVAHSCRNFDKLLEWTQARGLDKMINLKEKLDVGLPDFPIIT